MELLESLEEEIALRAEQLSVEMILLLIDKWEEDIQKALRDNKITAQELLQYYIRLKISFHHLNRKYERDYFYDLERQHFVESQIFSLKHKIKEARRNYYVAKHRNEIQHEPNCSCRGCNAIGAI